MCLLEQSFVFYEWKKCLTQLLPLFADSTPPLNTLLPSPGAWPYSASDSPLNNAHNSGNHIHTQHGVSLCDALSFFF